MDLLPEDLKSKIFQELDAINLCRLAPVSKATRILADSDESWKIVYGYPKNEAKEIHLKNSENLRDAFYQLEKCKAELDIATTCAFDASKELERIVFIRYEDVDSCKWNTYHTAVSELNFAEERLEEAESNLESAELEHWRLNGIVKADSYNLRVPLRLRKNAESALLEWKTHCSKMSSVGHLRVWAQSYTSKTTCEMERQLWWTARYAFRAINEWEGKVTAPDLLIKCISK
jgi:choline dehydrogenase-like flavoprotein